MTSGSPATWPSSEDGDESDIDDDWDWDTELGLLEPEPDLRPRPWVPPEPLRVPPRVPDPQPIALRAGGVGHFLRACRAQAGLSQRELARAAGVPQSTVARAEAEAGAGAGAGAGIRLGTLTRLVEACGVSLVGVVGPDAEPLQADLDQRHRDAAGRALPAHLVNGPVASWHGGWWGDDRYTHRRARPRRTYPRRSAPPPSS